MRVTVYGLWHLGSVTAACLSAAGYETIGFDADPQVIVNLQQGQAPLYEPGLNDLIAQGLQNHTLAFTSDPDAALQSADVVWVTFDTPVDVNDQADVSFVQEQLVAIADVIQPGTLVLISSQVPVGFTGSVEESWRSRGIHFAYSPENLRLGRAIDAFTKPERIIIGIRSSEDQMLLTQLFAPFCQRIEWMSIESAEMTKHALNAFLATSVTFINELARLCELVGADAREVERGLKSEGRIGPRAYLAPGAAFAGGTLARDVRFLTGFGAQHQIATPLFDGVLASNEQHKRWMRDTITRQLIGIQNPAVAVLGLTYKAGTNTLRRSTAVELCRWMSEQGIRVRAHDPAITELPAELQPLIELGATPDSVLSDADLVVIATEWPEYRQLTADQCVRAMRRAQVIDQNWLLADTLGRDPRIVYTATGRAGDRVS
jgi:UDPglucose 6-dehydrogenase